MIIVVSSNRFFYDGISVLSEQALKRADNFSRVVYSSNISHIEECVLSAAKAIIVDYSFPDFQSLVRLIEVKYKNTDCDVILIARQERFLNTAENILINTVSDLVIDVVADVKKLKLYLEYINAEKHSKIIIKNMAWSEIEKKINLTKKEDMILPYIISGKNNKEISRFIDISDKVVSQHRRSIYRKFNAHNLTEFYNAFQKATQITQTSDENTVGFC